MRSEWMINEETVKATKEAIPDIVAFGKDGGTAVSLTRLRKLASYKNVLKKFSQESY